VLLLYQVKSSFPYGTYIGSITHNWNNIMIANRLQCAHARSMSPLSILDFFLVCPGDDKGAFTAHVETISTISDYQKNIIQQ